MEQRLSGGNVADSVIRVGSTVRKPWTDASPAVGALLEHLAAKGFPGAPRFVGRDERGRQVIEFIPGRLSTELPPLTVEELRRLGALIRRFHDAAADFGAPATARWDIAVRPDREELVCHNDLGPWNLVRDADRWVFIDWDGAGPGSRLWDLAYATQSFVPLDPAGSLPAQQRRLRAIADGYDLTVDERTRLPELIAAHTHEMWRLLQSDRQPWARMNAEGHGSYWRASGDYVASHLTDWADALLE